MSPRMMARSTLPRLVRAKSEVIYEEGKQINSGESTEEAQAQS
jgi:hypothetical protein